MQSGDSARIRVGVNAVVQWISWTISPRLIFSSISHFDTLWTHRVSWFALVQTCKNWSLMNLWWAPSLHGSRDTTAPTMKARHLESLTSPVLHMSMIGTQTFLQQGMPFPDCCRIVCVCVCVCLHCVSCFQFNFEGVEVSFVFPFMSLYAILLLFEFYFGVLLCKSSVLFSFILILFQFFESLFRTTFKK